MKDKAPSARERAVARVRVQYPNWTLEEIGKECQLNARTIGDILQRPRVAALLEKSERPLWGRVHKAQNMALDHLLGYMKDPDAEVCQKAVLMLTKSLLEHPNAIPEGPADPLEIVDED